MPAILFALISFFGWALGDILIIYITRRIGSYSTAIWGFLFRLIFYSLFVPFVWNSLSNLTLDIFILNLILGVILLSGAVAFFEALRISSASLVGTIVASFPAITVILSTVFLKEAININQILAIAILFTGIILSTLNIKDLKNGKFISNKGIFLAFITMITWGIYFAFIKIPVNQIGWFWPAYFSIIVFPFILLIMRMRKIKLQKIDQKSILLPLIVSVIILAAGDFSYNFAVSQGLISVVAPIAGANPALFAPLAYFIFKDKITKQQVLGIATTLVGIVLLSVFSV